MTAFARLAALLLLLAAPVAAQTLPPDPAAAPPAPARLDAPPPPPGPRLAAPAMRFATLEPREGGAWRLRFARGEVVLAGAAAADLRELGRRLAALPAGRVGIIAQSSGPTADVSAARRLALARAEAVKHALADGGLAETRIDLRPLGRTAEGIDAVDVQPPDTGRAG